MDRPKGRLKEVASVFFRLGLIAFGGPTTHIAMMEEKVVEKRKWMEPSVVEICTVENVPCARFIEQQDLLEHIARVGISFL